MALTDPLLPRVSTVREIRRESDDVVTLSLEPPADYGTFLPGQFNMLYVPGAGEAAISICGDPADAGQLVHTLRIVGNVTRLLAGLNPGDTLGLRGPFGRGWPIEEATGRDLVILAGGIGLAPLRPVLYETLRQRERFGHISLLYGARTASDILYADQLLGWKDTHGLDLSVTVDTFTEGWAGDVGVVTGLIPRARFDAGNVLAMVCGPEIMIRFSVKTLIEQGVPGEQIHVSLERNMKCAVGFCGHCQVGPHFVCRDGPVFQYGDVATFLKTREF